MLGAIKGYPQILIKRLISNLSASNLALFGSADSS